MKGDTVSVKIFNQVAQAGHFAAGLAFVFGFAAMRWGAWYGAITVAALAAIKEFWYDVKYEDPIVRGSGLEDFLFYLFGAWAAIVLLVFRKAI